MRLHLSAMWNSLTEFWRASLFNKLHTLENLYYKAKGLFLYRLVFKRFGRGSLIRKPLLISNPGFISIGNGVSIRDGGRLEVVRPSDRRIPHLSIGDDTNIEQNVHIVCHNRVKIGSNVSITGNCSIVDVTHPYADVTDTKKVGIRILDEDSFVEIGDGSFIGFGCVILPNVRIGMKVVIGANSVVTHDVPDYSAMAAERASGHSQALRCYERNLGESCNRSKADDFSRMSCELTACPLCEGKILRQIYLAKDRHYGIPGLYRIVRCSSCSLVFLNPMYCDRELSAMYPRNYYAYQDNFERSRWKEIAKMVFGYHVGTRDPAFRKPGRMLDLGCGSGWFMRVLQNQGWETHGVEINDAAADLGRKSAGLNIRSGDLGQANYPSAFFDYIRSNHSFEHISCPDETLDEMYRILRPEGKILIGVPNVGGLNARLFREYWWYLGAPVHPFTYSVGTLSKLLEKHRFRVQKIVYNSDYSGILGSFQIWLNRQNGRKSTEGAFVNNPLLRIVCHWIAKGVDLLGIGDAIEITAVKAD